MEAVGPERLAYRRKVCIVGPSGSGKTSLAKSIAARAPVLEEREDRALDIALHALRFEQEETATSATEFELTLWVYGGPDVFQSAHSVFFSKDALYVLCVDVQKYAAALDEIAGMSLRQGEAAQSRFMTRHVFSWLRLIYSRDPSAEVLVVGTKTDLLRDDKALAQVWRDLRLQLSEWKRHFVEDVETELRIAEESGGAAADANARRTTLSIHHSYSGSAHHASSFGDLREIVNAISFDEWVPVSCKDQASIDNARQALEAKVSASDKNVDMSGRNAQVLEIIAKRRAAAQKLSSARARIESMIVPVHALFRIMQSVDGVEYEDCPDVLRTLHNLGEIAWFETESSGKALKDYVILDNRLVINLMREALNHELSDTAGDLSITHFEEGRVKHEVLGSFPIWKDLDDELMHAFKLLLQYFQLAYPANDQEVDFDSDLIVPAYWKVRKPAVDKRLLQQRTMMARKGIVAVASLCWEYELTAELSEMVFEQFAVQSNTSLFHRTVWPNCIESFVEGEFASRIAISPGEMNRDVICIEVAVENVDVGWQYLRYWAMTLEKVLDNYPGLSVSRYIVDTSGDRHRLSEATSALQSAVSSGSDEEQVRRAMPWLPPDLNWYIEKAWQHPGKLQQLQMRDLVKQTVSRLDVLQKLIVAGDTHRKYPALWTLEYDEASKTIVLQMLSDLSGTCFHTPIQISVPPQFLSKYGSWLQNGLWVCSNVVPEVVSLGIVQKVIGWVTPAINTKVEEAKAVHSLIQDLDLSQASGFNSRGDTNALSPRGTMALLRDILKMYDGNIDELTICDLCNLECAATAEGYYVWAHRHEIMSMGDQLTPCDRDDFKISGVVAHTPSAPATDNQQQDDPPASPTNSSSPTNSPRALPDPKHSHSSSTNSLTSTSSSSTSKFLPLSLTFECANGLSEWDWRRTYCKWQLLYGQSGTPLAAGVTAQHTDFSSPPNWKSTSPSFTLSCVVSVDMLRECRLSIRLKRPSRFVVTTKLIGEGSVWLRDFIYDDDAQQFECKPIEIPVGSDGAVNQSVSCTLGAL